MVLVGMLVLYVDIGASFVAEAQLLKFTCHIFDEIYIFFRTGNLTSEFGWDERVEKCYGYH